VRSDLVTLEWIRDRIAATLDPVTLVEVDSSIGALGAAVGDGDLDAAAASAQELRGILRGLV
jgi:hypothetical protein